VFFYHLLFDGFLNQETAGITVLGTNLGEDNFDSFFCAFDGVLRGMLEKFSHFPLHMIQSHYRDLDLVLGQLSIDNKGDSMDPRMIRKCREFVDNRELQKQALAMSLKLQVFNENKYVEVGRRLGELKPFIDYIYNDIESKYGTPANFYQSCGISRQVFNNMQKNDYDPMLETVYKILIGLKLNILDATILMENAGYTFTFKTINQLVIIFCLLERIYNPNDVDELLVSLAQRALFSLE
jgi:hypothetical protein